MYVQKCTYIFVLTFYSPFITSIYCWGFEISRNKNSYIKFYDNQYRIIYSNNYKNNLDDFFKKQIKRGEKIYSFIEDKFHLERTQKILDVGCGMGGVLIPFLNQGHQVKGVDYGSQYIEYGKKLKLNL